MAGSLSQSPTTKQCWPESVNPGKHNLLCQSTAVLSITHIRQESLSLAMSAPQCRRPKALLIASRAEQANGKCQASCIEQNLLNGGET